MTYNKEDEKTPVEPTPPVTSAKPEEATPPVKKILGLVLGLALTLGLAGTASASSAITNVRFDNGQTSKDCTAGQTLSVTFRVTVPAGEVAELGQVDVLGDALAPELPVSLGNELGLQEGPHDVTATVPCPQNTGYYTVEYRTAGIFGGTRAVTMTDGVTSVGTFGSAIRVVSSTTSNSTVGTTSQWDQLMAMIAALLAKPAPVVPPVVVPTVNPKCTLIAPFLGAPSGTYSAAGTQLQSVLLLDNPYSIPALRPGSNIPQGFRGVQTEAALSSYLTTYSCR